MILSGNYKEYKELIDSASDADKLRTILLSVEAAIKSKVGEEPCLFYLDRPSDDILEQINELLYIRRDILDKLFTYTEEEIRLIEQTNELLFNLNKQMYQRTVNLYRCILQYGGDKDFDDDYMVEGFLKANVEYDPETGNGNTVRHFTNDIHYGSDFEYMLYVIQENEEERRGSMKNIVECSVKHCFSNTSNMTDKELHCDYTFLDDGETWIGWHECPQLANTCICFAFHSMFDHHPYALADIIRVDSFEVQAQIICQRITNQKGQRWKEIYSKV